MNIRFEHDCIRLDNLPIPPSVNDYVNKRYPTKKKKEFLKSWENWVMQVTKIENIKVLKFLFGTTKKRKQFIERKALATIRVEYMWTTRLTTKDGKRMKIFDSSNRLKLIEDSLAKFIGIDDCYFKEFTWETFNHKDEAFCARIYRPCFFR